MDEDKISNRIDSTINRLLAAAEIAKGKIRDYLMGLDKETMKVELREYKTSELKELSSTIEALENESYEICQAIKEVLEERKSN